MKKITLLITIISLSLSACKSQESEMSAKEKQKNSVLSQTEKFLFKTLHDSSSYQMVSFTLIDSFNESRICENHIKLSEKSIKVFTDIIKDMTEINNTMKELGEKTDDSLIVSSKIELMNIGAEIDSCKKLINYYKKYTSEDSIKVNVYKLTLRGKNAFGALIIDNMYVIHNIDESFYKLTNKQKLFFVKEYEPMDMRLYLSNIEKGFQTLKK